MIIVCHLVVHSIQFLIFKNVTGVMYRNTNGGGEGGTLESSLQECLSSPSASPLPGSSSIHSTTSLTSLHNTSFLSSCLIYNLAEQILTCKPSLPWLSKSKNSTVSPCHVSKYVREHIKVNLVLLLFQLS